MIKLQVNKRYNNIYIYRGSILWVNQNKHSLSSTQCPKHHKYTFLWPRVQTHQENHQHQTPGPFNNMKSILPTISMRMSPIQGKRSPYTSNRSWQARLVHEDKENKTSITLAKQRTRWLKRYALYTRWAKDVLTICNLSNEQHSSKLGMLRDNTEELKC